MDKGLSGMTESGVLTLERLLCAEARAFLRAVIPEWVLKKPLAVELSKSAGLQARAPRSQSTLGCFNFQVTKESATHWGNPG